MTLRFLSSLLALSAALLFIGCKPSAKSMLAEPDLISEYTFGEEDASMRQEVRELIHHYLRTGDARASSPTHKLTMLHLAATHHRLWLVEQLLAEGADPNARAFFSVRDGAKTEYVPAFTPAYLAVNAGGYGKYNADALHVVRALVTAGADLNIPGYTGNILSACDNDWGKENILSSDELAVELIRLGARANDCDVMNMVGRSQAKALAAVHATPEGKRLIESHVAELLRWSARSFSARPGEIACAEFLLQQYPTLPAWKEDEPSPLFILAQYNVSKIFHPDDSEAKHARIADFMALLLRHGDDPQRAGGDFRHSCPADYIAASPKITELLSERGFDISAPAHHFSADTLVEQLLDIPSAAIRAVEVSEQAYLLNSLFTAPTEAMVATPSHYRQACGKALMLLLKTDATREQTQTMLRQLPAWRDPAAWQGDAHAARGLLSALRANDWSFPIAADFLLESARAMLAADRPDAAHAWCLLLGMGHENDNLIEELCGESTPLPLRAAALSCKLKRNNMPTLGRVREWLSQHCRHNPGGKHPIEVALNADISVRCLNKSSARPTTERLAYQPDESVDPCEPPTRNERTNIITALRTLGAPLAARLCGDAEPTAPAPEVAILAERYGDEVAASLELEQAFSLYILKHKQAFDSPWTYGNEEVAEKEEESDADKLSAAASQT